MTVVENSIAVTGASGLLGANLVLEFSRLGHQVTAVYGRHSVNFPGVRSVPCSLAESGAAARLLESRRAAWIVHCAAATNVDWCESHPAECMRVNAEAAGALARAARSIGARLVYISTDSVFDGVSGGYRETDPVSPVNHYARSKASGESAILHEMPDALVLRTNIYGWNLQSKHSLAEWALARLEGGEVVPGFRDVSFSPLLVNDLALCIGQLLAAGCSGIFHAGAAQPCSKYQFLRHTADIFQLNAELVRESSLDRAAFAAPRPHHTWLRVDKISAVLGHAMPSVRDGLVRFRRSRENGLSNCLKAAGLGVTT
jgi:dTDP-4-dehydrorhamnose reductase